MELVASYFFAAFGLFSIVGGVIGFKKAGSRYSLIAGSVFGALLAVAALLFAFEFTKSGVYVGGASSCVLLLRFGPAFLKSRKLMPAGLMASFGAIGLLLANWIMFVH
ncbi:MAG: TMEM14 family protein [Polyangiaceae bacterium]|nr:TMEM14 family protein [Polyangiaceae bacterium]